MEAAHSVCADDVPAELAQLDAQLRRIDIARIHSSHRESILSHYPLGIRVALSRKYLRTATDTRRVLHGAARTEAILAGRGADSWAQANLDLSADHQRLKECRVHLAWSDGAIRDMARQCSDICSSLARNHSAETAYQSVCQYAAHHQIRVPKPERGKTLSGCVARLCEPKWWRRAIRSSYARQSEEAERDLGLVSQRTGLYASDDSVARRRAQKARNRDMLESMLAVNDLGECLSLAQLSDVNVSNPKIRRAELMTRIAGFEDYADAAGHPGYFITLTLPSRFHCIRKLSGTRNPRYDGSSVADGQKFFCKQWSQLRSHLRHRQLSLYGFRIAEPHHDGTVHWHLLVFMEPGSADATLRAFTSYFDPDEEQEPGSSRRRVEVVPIDKNKGSAAGYIAKYVSKNIDGFRVGDDAEAGGASRAATDTVQRVDAWASTSGIRQFQQIGGPPVSVWRELRRIRTPCKGVIEDARLAAESPDWKHYWEVQGGHRCGTGARPVQLYTGTGPKPGIYGEPIERQIKGVRTGAVVVPTRARTWTFVRDPESGSPWTRVNNCAEASCRGERTRSASMTIASDRSGPVHYEPVPTRSTGNRTTPRPCGHR